MILCLLEALLRVSVHLSICSNYNSELFCCCYYSRVFDGLDHIMPSLHTFFLE